MIIRKETKSLDLSLLIRRHIKIIWEVFSTMHTTGRFTDISSQFFWGLDTGMRAEKFPPIGYSRSSPQS